MTAPLIIYNFAHHAVVFSSNYILLNEEVEGGQWVTRVRLAMSQNKVYLSQYVLEKKKRQVRAATHQRQASFIVVV